MGLIDTKIAQSQIRRLASVRGWKDLNDDGKRELLETLVSASSSDYHARGIIDKWLQTQTWLPAPAELRAIADDVPTSEPKIHKSGCSLCAGTGRDSYWADVEISRWPNGEVRKRIAHRIHASPGAENQYLVSCPTNYPDAVMVSGYCLCEYGQHLRTIQGPVMRGEA
jgi:hypothetical protein